MFKADYVVDFFIAINYTSKADLEVHLNQMLQQLCAYQLIGLAKFTSYVKSLDLEIAVEKYLRAYFG